MRGGGMPVSRPNGISSLLIPEPLELIGGPASSGVRNAFSHEPSLGSLDIIGEG